MLIEQQELTDIVNIYKNLTFDSITEDLSTNVLL